MAVLMLLLLPVAVMLGRPNAGVLHSLATDWKAQGRELFVVSYWPKTISRSRMASASDR